MKLKKQWTSGRAEVYRNGKLIAVAISEDSRLRATHVAFIAAACNHYVQFIGEAGQNGIVKLEGQMELFDA